MRKYENIEGLELKIRPQKQDLPTYLPTFFLGLGSIPSWFLAKVSGEWLEYQKKNWPTLQTTEIWSQNHIERFWHQVNELKYLHPQCDWSKLCIRCLAQLFTECQNQVLRSFRIYLKKKKRKYFYSLKR